ncbi:ABC transporter permease [Rhizobium lusitanum]|uniref:ABC transporter permease n=1 Tax=Rhizobium lusitanum TaxID=293958 RepID=UPI001574E65C|nr:ABC transporter permease subunit [Rhizobium lusitanum]NTJ11621.1 ABC transporter permease subunit [Rhizobium lusitanum]
MQIGAGYRDMLLSGMSTTLLLSLSALLLALVIGLIMAVLKQFGGRFIGGVATLYTTVIRGIPDIALMLLLYYSLQIWLNNFTDWLGWEQIEISPFGAGVIALGFIFGAYFTETFRGAFMAVSAGQLEAGLAYGLTRRACFSRILFPQMMRFALPGIANNWLVMVKATALVSLVGLSDITRAAQDAGRGSGKILLFLFISAAFYLAVTTISSIAIHFLSRRYSAGVQELMA